MFLSGCVTDEGVYVGQYVYVCSSASVFIFMVVGYPVRCFVILLNTV